VFCVWGGGGGGGGGVELVLMHACVWMCVFTTCSQRV